MTATQITNDINALQALKQIKSPSIIQESKIYGVYDRYAFLDPKFDDIESAIEALELHLTDLEGGF